MRQRKRKPEFSKIILGAVMSLYFITSIYAIFVAAFNPELLGELLTFIGAPTAVAIGFYAWKAKAENVIKISSSDKIKEKFIESECDDLVTGTDNTDNNWSDSGDCDNSIPCYKSEDQSKRVVKIRRVRSGKDVRDGDGSAQTPDGL